MTGSIGAELVILVALVALWLVVLRDAWRAWRPSRLLLQGRYREARTAAEALQRSWMRVFPNVRLSARYTIGCALHLEGDLEGSLAALAPLHREELRGNLRYAVYAIDAASLVLLDRDPIRASELLAEVARIHRPPEDILLAALAKRAAGDVPAADHLFAAAGTERSGGAQRLGTVVLLEDRRQQEAIFHSLRGLYLVRSGRASEAERDFEIAARSPISNHYVERARAMRQAVNVDQSDPRSSLAPQVVANMDSTSVSED